MLELKKIRQIREKLEDDAHLYMIMGYQEIAKQMIAEIDKISRIIFEKIMGGQL